MCYAWDFFVEKQKDKEHNMKWHELLIMPFQRLVNYFYKLFSYFFRFTRITPMLPLKAGTKRCWLILFVGMPG